MVKHNNQVPNAHFHKKWATSSRGPLKVRTWFSQPAQKKARRLKRAAKAAAIAPRPLARLRPAVQCQTARYASKTRLGRGFTLEELKGAGIAPALAKTIGISVDYRRKNKSEESLVNNVDRLKLYKEKLVLFPRKGTKPALPEHSAPTTGPLMPLEKKVEEVEFVDLTEELTSAPAYAKLRQVRNDKKLVGIRKKIEEAKKADK
ncbi:hypothetical protein CTAYLR_009336 [Chrysophaeum taylorii]|uniref:60S ribosomal protein L13 n=1 Tax=Chrysophaeum taylorii TaxID=2483200 RepID=A0AAD7U9Y9_9STRA|nr:hypothetical protein CTAYLR_009336 [Chrysophaeum taylorii]